MLKSAFIFGLPHSNWLALPPPAKPLGMGGAVSTKAALAKAKAARSKMEDAATSGKVCVHSAHLLAASVFVGVFALARCCPSLKRA